MMLLALVVVPLVFAGVVALCPPALIRRLALVGTLVPLFLGVFALSGFEWSMTGTTQYEYAVEWLPKLGLTLSFGADGVSMLLVALTLLLGPICVLASETAITERLRTYYAWFLVLQGAMTGVFVAQDLIFFYICFEFTLIPMFILINLYGSTNRHRAAVKFFMYTFTGSLVALAGLAYVAWNHATLAGSWTFDIATLAQSARELPASEQAWVLLALMAGFAVKVPLFPVHTWLPLAHTEAPTAGSVILAGVLLKLGTYALYRFAMPFAPVAFIEYAPLIATLCIIGILYGGLICWVQRDVKKLVAYSSVAHLGFCVLGLAAANHVGVTGAVLYMINHGLSTGALFLLIGMVYERYHTRSLRELGGLAAKMPIWATFMVFFTMASVGLPGLNGFVSEFMCLMGTFQASETWGGSTLASGPWGSNGAAVPGATLGNLGPWYALVAGVGMVIAAIYLLYMLGVIVWGPLVLPHGHGHDGHGSGGHGHASKHEPGKHDSKHDGKHDTGGHDSHGGLPTDLSGREIGILVPLAILCIVLGVYPKLATDAIHGSVASVVGTVDQARQAMGIPTSSDRVALDGETP
ncbi:MAG: NADH-quinone oxidoreductase subunit M [Planctomycetota bacterium]|nr:NADH-quinone oxidoreductase subunit M [Planctomycetota bacterium]